MPLPERIKKSVVEFATKQVLHDLWGMGFTVVPRRISTDPFDFDPSVIPAGKAYQWIPIKEDDGLKEKYVDWTPVLYADHEGIFAPFGTPGNVEVSGMALCWKPKEKVDNTPEHARQRYKDQVEDWSRRFGGFAGGARVVSFDDGDKATVTEIEIGGEMETRVETIERPKEKTVELVTQVPKDMGEHMDAVFVERDRIRDEILTEEDKDEAEGRRFFIYPIPEQHREMVHKFFDAMNDDKVAPWWPTLHAIILPYAIEAVRKQLKEKAS